MVLIVDLFCYGVGDRKSVFDVRVGVRSSHTLGVTNTATI
jgi:hypothetical protein